MTDTMFSTRQAPWMTLGALIDEPVTAKEAATLGGLDFEVELLPAGYMKDGKFIEATNRQAVVHADTGQFMSYTSKNIYHSLQYKDAFDFMDVINPKYTAAGTLRKGRQGFMVAKTELQLKPLNGEDPHDLYAVLRTSHDMSRATEILVMPLRGRCMNQLTLRSFAKDIDYRWSIKHTPTQSAKLAEAHESLAKIGAYTKRYELIVGKLAALQVKPDRAQSLIKMVIPAPRKNTERVMTQYEERIQKIMDLWTSSPTVAYAGTGWGLLNATSEYWDWHRTGGTAESQFLNALEGETHKVINRMCGALLSNA